MDNDQLRAAVERAVGEAVEKHAADLRTSVTSAVLRQVQAAGAGAAHDSGTSSSGSLHAAVASVQDANSQADILAALLDGADKFSRRSGLFIVKGGSVTGWQARAFDTESFRKIQLDPSRGLAERAIRTRQVVAGSAAELDSSFVQRFGSPSDGNATLLPLIVRGRVAALLYADGGDAGASGLDSPALEVLVNTTGLWLEVLSWRRASGDTGVGTATTSMAAVHEAAPDTQAVDKRNATGSMPSVSDASEDEIHNKARRFAKLLVEEIKLYNQAKVAEGKRNRDLYDRLRDDIEKSRAAYQKRFGDSVTDIDYFSSELVRVLADNDRALLGSNLPG